MMTPETNEAAASQLPSSCKEENVKVRVLGSDLFPNSSQPSVTPPSAAPPGPEH